MHTATDMVAPLGMKDGLMGTIRGAVAGVRDRKE